MAKENNWSILFQNGDSLTYHQVFRLYYRPLCFFADRIIKNKPDSEDIVTDSFVKLLQVNLNKNHPSELRSYLFTTTRNACIDYLRKQKRQKNAFEGFAANYEEEGLGLNNEMIFAQILQMVYEEIENLPDQCQRVFKGIFIDGKSTETLAKELSISRQTVLNHKARGLQFIKTAMLKKGIKEDLVVLIISFLLHHF